MRKANSHRTRRANSRIPTGLHRGPQWQPRLAPGAAQERGSGKVSASMSHWLTHALASGKAAGLLGTLCQPTSPSASAAAQPMPEVLVGALATVPRPASASSTRRCARCEPGALPRSCSAARAHLRAPGPASRHTGGFVVALRALPNPSVNASPNGWPVLPCLGHFAYPPSQFRPGQPPGPRYLKR